MEIPFYSAKDYTIDSVNGVCLRKERMNKYDSK